MRPWRAARWSGGPDLGQRYQWVAYSDPPGDGWHLDDIRTYTNLVPSDPAPVPTMLSERY